MFCSHSDTDENTEVKMFLSNQTTCNNKQVFTLLRVLLRCDMSILISLVQLIVKEQTENEAHHTANILNK